jgi:hypothetical protein
MTIGSIKPTGATVTRSIEAQLGDVVNVKSFGAIGDGSADDSGAIQAAFNVAFGSTAAPHGNAGRFQNKPVFFPAGNYRVVTPLTLRSVMGGFIYGAGSNCTRLFYAGVIAGAPTPTSLIRTNGMAYSRWEDLHLSVAGDNTVAFYMGWDNTGDVALNANQFANMKFESTGGPLDGFQTQGILIGHDGYMGSENIFLNCVWDGFSHAALKTRNSNALSQTVIGGKVINSQTGLWAQLGSIGAIVGVQFAGNTLYDISNNNADSMIVSGCTSTSANFCLNDNAFMSVMGITHAGTASGKFLQMNSGATVVDSCFVGNGSTGVGVISGASSKVYLRANNFRASDYLTAFTGTVSQNI